MSGFHEFRKRAVWLAPLLLLLLCTLVHAQDGTVRYVDDVILINLRTAPQPGAETIEVIPSGTRMTVLQSDDESGYSQVRLDNGTVGWVRHQYLTDEPIARDRVADAEAAVGRLQSERDRLRSELAEAVSERNELRSRVDDLDQQNNSLDSELAEIRDISANALETSQRVRELEASVRDETGLRQEAEAQAASAESKLLIVSGIAAIVGLGAGFYIGSMPIRRERRWRKVS